MFVSNAFVVAALFARSAFAAAALNDPTQVIQGVSGIGSGVSKLYSIGHKLNDAVPAGSAANMPYLNTVNQAINNVGPGTVPAAGSLTGSLPVTAPATGVVGQCLYSPGAITNAASLSGLQNVANYPNLGPALLSGVPLTQCGLVPAVLDLVKHILGGSGSGAPLGGLGGLLTGGGGSGLLIGLLGSGPVQPVLLNLALILGAVPNLQHQLQPACGCAPSVLGGLLNELVAAVVELLHEILGTAKLAGGCGCVSPGVYRQLPGVLPAAGSLTPLPVYH